MKMNKKTLFCILVALANLSLTVRSDDIIEDSDHEEIQLQSEEGNPVKTGCTQDFTPYESDKKKFYRCSNGYSILMDCPNGTIYTGEGICDKENIYDLLKSHNKPCKNKCVHGICVRVGYNYQCVCYKGWTGPRCDQVIPKKTTTTATTRRRPCNPNPCLNGGTCIAENDVPHCICPVGWDGISCEIISISLGQNISVRVLLGAGYKLIYNYPYQHDTTFAEMNIIRSICSPTSIICLGGSSAVNPNNLILVSCGNCLQALGTTPVNSPHLVNGANWYLTPSYSVGFSDVALIQQNTCDVKLPADKKKLCWHLNYPFGGWRLGSILGIFNTNYYKKIFLKL